MRALLAGLLRGEWPLRSVVAVCLGFCMAPVTALVLTALSAQGSSGAEVFAGSVGIVAMASAIAGLGSTVDAWVRSRRRLTDVLDTIGCRRWRIWAVLAAEGAVAALIGGMLSVLIAAALSPVWGGYLRRLRIADIQLDGDAVLLTIPIALVLALVVQQVSLVRVFVNVLRDTAPRDTARPYRSRVRRVLRWLGMGLTTAVCAGLWLLSGTTQAGLAVGMLAGVLSLFLIGPWTRACYAASEMLLRRIRPRGILFALRFASGQAVAMGRSAGVVGVTLAVFGGGFIVGHYVVSDATVRQKWTQAVGSDNRVQEVTGKALPPPAAKSGLSWMGTVQVTSNSTVLLLPPTQAARVSRPSGGTGWTPGQIVASKVAYPDGLNPPSARLDAAVAALQLKTHAGLDSATVPAVAVPATFGSFMYVCRTDGCGEVGAPLSWLLLIGDERSLTNAVPAGDAAGPVMTAQTWADSLPSKGLVSQSGGAGVEEAALISAVPILLGLALVFNHTLAAELREAEQRRRTRILGAGPRWRVLVTSSNAVLMVVAPGILVMLIAVALLRWADHLAFAALGAPPTWAAALACGGIAVTASLIAHACALALAPRLVKPDEA